MRLLQLPRIDSLPPRRRFLNSGMWTFIPYRRSLRTSDWVYKTGLLQVSVSVARFFENYAEYADRAFLSVKGGCLPEKLDIDGSGASLLRSVEYATDDLMISLKLCVERSGSICFSPRVTIRTTKLNIMRRCSMNCTRKGSLYRLIWSCGRDHTPRTQGANSPIFA